MSIRVFGWDDPGLKLRLFNISNNRAELAAKAGTHRFVKHPDGRTVLQQCPPKHILQERTARNMILPYGRGPLGLIKAPPSINYPIPAVADHRTSWLMAFMAMPADKPKDPIAC